jgi:hypothetical protein
VQLAAPGALPDLGAHDSLELAQQLVLGRARALAAAGEDDLHPGMVELFEQQHLVGVAARQPVGRVAEQHLEAALGGAVAQALQRRSGQRRTRDPLVLKGELLVDDQPVRRGELTQPGDLALDRALLALALGRHPRVDRRHPARPLLRL